MQDDPSLPACPMHWSAPLHALNCELLFPPELDTPPPHSASALSRFVDLLLSTVPIGQPRPVYLELDTPQYAGKIKDQKILEKLLAMGGVRLAAVLNELFDPSPEGIGRITTDMRL
ncbi:hypothetical protein FRB99_000596 [Tulasnella sp. 403]|nr:hypothetical protein FRB99_000596 [Tulasnella sp. 403]